MGLRAVFPFVPMLAGVLAGCRPAEPTDGAENRVTVETVEGIVRVSNHGRPHEWSLTEVLTLGSQGDVADEPPPDEFGWISGVIADSARRIYVADALAAEIRVFDEGGDLLRRLGRPGSGPGEFRALMTIAWLGEHLATIDPGNGRFGIMSTTGEWIDQRPYRGGDALSLLSAGPEAVYMPVTRATDRGFELAYVRQELRGPADTLSGITGPQVEDLGSRCTYDGGAITGRREASFAPKLLRVPAPGMLWAEVWTADYRIVFRTSAGDTVRIVERDLPRREVDEAAWERELEAFGEFLEEHPDASCDPRRLPRPTHASLLRSVFFDVDGGMWVERVSDTGFVLDSFDGDGRLLGQVAIPSRVERVSPHVHDDRLYLVVSDTLDRQSVRVFELVRSAASRE